jgi:hypothetical protein
MATISPKQLGKYRFEWSRVRKALVELGDFSPSDAEAERKVIQREAIGCEKSSKDLTNKELNLVLDAFDKILVLFDGPTVKPSRNAANLIFSITRTGLPDDYLAPIAQDQFGTMDWRSLDEDKLRKFLFTAVARAASKRKADRAATGDVS